MGIEDTKQLWREFVGHASRALASLQAEEQQQQQQQQQPGNAQSASGSAASHDNFHAAAAAFDPLEEHQFLYYGTSKLPDGCPPGSALARIYTLVRRQRSPCRHFLRSLQSWVGRAIKRSVPAGPPHSHAAMQPLSDRDRLQRVLPKLLA
jgi:hypothetical protein